MVTRKISGRIFYRLRCHYGLTTGRIPRIIGRARWYRFLTGADGRSSSEGASLEHLQGPPNICLPPGLFAHDVKNTHHFAQSVHPRSAWHLALD
jgi:hypothetical protein